MFKVFTAVNIAVVFWVVMLCSVVVGYHCFRGPFCHPEDGGSKFLWNICILL